MSNYVEVTYFPDCASIYCKVKRRTDIESKSSTVECSPPLEGLLLMFVSPALLHLIPLIGFSVIDPECNCVYVYMTYMIVYVYVCMIVCMSLLICI